MDLKKVRNRKNTKILGNKTTKDRRGNQMFNRPCNFQENNYDD